MAPKSSLQGAEHRSTPSPSDSSSDSSSSSSSSSKAEQEEQVEDQALPTKSRSPSPPHVVDKKASLNAAAPTCTPIKPTASSSSSSSSASQANSDSPPKRPGSSPSPKLNKARVSTPSSAKPSKSKRPREILIELPSKDLNRPKKKIPQHEEERGKRSVEDSKRQLFQRIWSEDDEIAVLKGMAYYFAKRGCVPYPNGNMDEFHDFIRDSLQGQFSRGQLTDKVRRLKRKFENNLSRSKLGGEPTFKKPHEQKSFKLSKKIWGCERIMAGFQSSRKSSGKARRQPKLMEAEAEEEEEEGEEEGEGEGEGEGEEVEEEEGEEEVEEREEEALPREVKEKNAVKLVKVPKPKPRPSKKHTSVVLDIARAEINESVGMSSALVEAIKMGMGGLSETVKADLKKEWDKLIEEEFHVYTKKLTLIQAEARGNAFFQIKKSVKF